MLWYGAEVFERGPGLFGSWVLKQSIFLNFLVILMGQSSAWADSTRYLMPAPLLPPEGSIRSARNHFLSADLADLFPTELQTSAKRVFHGDLIYSVGELLARLRSQKSRTQKNILLSGWVREIERDHGTPWRSLRFPGGLRHYLVHQLAQHGLHPWTTDEQTHLWLKGQPLILALQDAPAEMLMARPIDKLPLPPLPQFPKTATLEDLVFERLSTTNASSNQALALAHSLLYSKFDFQFVGERFELNYGQKIPLDRVASYLQLRLNSFFTEEDQSAVIDHLIELKITTVFEFVHKLKLLAKAFAFSPFEFSDIPSADLGAQLTAHLRIHYPRFNWRSDILTRWIQSLRFLGVEQWPNESTLGVFKKIIDRDCQRHVTQRVGP